MKTWEEEIILSDKSKNRINYFSFEDPVCEINLMLPAMGVRASFYNSFAEKLAKDKKSTVATIDLRGLGRSTSRASRNVDYGYETYIQDLHVITQHLLNYYNLNKIKILGHSLGGQLACLYASRYPTNIEITTIIATCLPYYKSWKLQDRIRLFIAGQVFHPLSRIIGYFPGDKIGFAGREFRTVMKDWSYAVKTGNYLITGSDFDYETAISQYNGPITSISFDNDNLSSSKAVDTLLNKFKNSSKIEKHVINGFNHFNWAKDPTQTVKYC